MIEMPYWENHFHAEVLPDERRVSFDNHPYYTHVLFHRLTSNNDYDSYPNPVDHFHVLSLSHHRMPLTMY